MNYKVVVVKDGDVSWAAKKLEQEVNEHIRNGWKPLGGISVSKALYGIYDVTVLAQAMTK